MTELYRKAQDYQIFHILFNVSASTCELCQIDFLTFIKTDVYFEGDLSGIHLCILA